MSVGLLIALACPERRTDGCEPTSVDSMVDSRGADTSRDSGPDSSVPIDSAEPCDSGETYFADRDGDGFGDGSRVSTCDDPHGVAVVAGDCDDNNAAVHPEASEAATTGVDDNCDGALAAMPLDDVASWEVLGDDAGHSDGLGDGVAFVGDVGCDGGRAFAVVESLGRDEEGNWHSGAGYIFAGSPAALTPSVTPEDAGATLVGGALEQLAWMSGLGDFDGDGCDDLAFGGYGEAYGVDDGQVYVVLGPVEAGFTNLGTAASDAEGVQRYTDERGGTQLGRNIGPGDVDGDGLGELVVAASDASGRLDGAGAVFILTRLNGQGDVASARTVLLGSREDGGNNIGQTLTSTGDLDGDGLADFATGASSGGAYLVTGPPPEGVSLMADVATLVVWDAAEPTRQGVPFVQTLGDIDGDGSVDLGASWGGDYLQVTFGPFGGLDVLELGTVGGAFLVSPNGGAESIVVAAAGVGDWNGDGSNDMVVGNHAYIPDELRVDASCIYEGKNDCTAGGVFVLAGPVVPGTVDLDVEADVVFGANEDEMIGYVLVSGADVSADGVWDLLLGGKQRRRAELVLGGP